jgi:ribose transport system substrate-binding protein
MTVLLALSLVASLAACSSQTASAGPMKVTLMVANTQLNFAREMGYGFDSGVREVSGVQSAVIGPDIVDGAKEVQLFQNVAATKTDGISVFTLSPELFAAPLTRAARQGVPLIAVDNPPAPGSSVDTFVGNDNFKLGEMLAGEVAARLPANATGSIVLGTTQPGVQVLDRRISGMRSELRKRLPSARVLGPFDTKQEVAANLAAWRILSQANPHALAFLGSGDADGWDLAAIRKSTHGAWIAGAYDLDPRSLAAVKAGDLLLVSPEHFVKGAVAGRLQAEHAKTGQALPKGWIRTDGLAVTPTNVDAIIVRQASQAAREKWFAPILARMFSDRSKYLFPLSQAG